MDFADMDGRYFHYSLSIMGNSLTIKCQLRVQDSPGIYSSSRPTF